HSRCVAISGSSFEPAISSSPARDRRARPAPPVLRALRRMRARAAARARDRARIAPAESARNVHRARVGAWVPRAPVSPSQYEAEPLPDAADLPLAILSAAKPAPLYPTALPPRALLCHIWLVLPGPAYVAAPECRAGPFPRVFLSA